MIINNGWIISNKASSRCFKNLIDDASLNYIPKKTPFIGKR